MTKSGFCRQKEGFVHVKPTPGLPAGYGCFLILPLKYDPDTFQPARLAQMGRRLPVTTMDLNENVKAMLAGSDAASVGEGWLLPAQALTAPLGARPGPGPGPALSGPFPGRLLPL